MPKSTTTSLSLENPPEMERLLLKYKGGNIPSLFGDEDDEGIFGDKGKQIINIYLAGFSKTYNIPLDLHPTPNSWIQEIRQTEDGDPPYEKLKELISSCQAMQPMNDDIVRPTEECCKYCLRKYLLTPNSREPMAYLCYTGMICFTAPIYVSKRIVGLLSTECYKPKEGLIWPKELVRQDFCLSAISEFDEIKSQQWKDNEYSSQQKVDIWNESKHHIHECEEILGTKPNELLNKINEKLEKNILKEIAPENAKSMLLDRLEQASDYLSELLNQKYKLEKESIIGWIRAEMGSSLSTVEGFWDKIRWCLGNLVKLIGMDYIMLISYDISSIPSLNLQCYYGLPEEAIPAMQYDYLTDQLDGFMDKLKSGDQIQEIDLKQYRDMPIMGILYNTFGKGANYPIVTVSTDSLNYGKNFMVLGRKNPELSHRILIENDVDQIYNDSSGINHWLRDDDRENIITIARELSIIIRVFFSIKKIEETKEEQTNLIESVAHDLKTPIYNIMLAADNLRNARMSPERAFRTINGVVTQLERLNLFAQKAWMLEQIRQNELVYNDDNVVNIYKILSECRDTMSDLASDKSIEIHIDKEIEKWRSIKIDSEKFSLVVMNLIHNGVKYSFPDTTIKIGGWRDSAYSGIVLTFANDGIQIHDEEKDHIFERHYRSRDAIKTDPTGSGIGLVLVKDFIDHYKGRIDVRSTEISFSKFLNVFSLYLPGR